MPNARYLAGLIGPTLIALGATESINIAMSRQQIAPVVYLNGTILFVVGLALIRAHNRWHWQWPILVTLTGWVLFLGGAYRMLMPEASQSPATTASHAMFAAMIVIGLFLSFKGYGPENGEKGDGR